VKTPVFHFRKRCSPAKSRARIDLASAVFRQGSECAFSLVEICVALGVVSFAFIGIFGLLLQGMNVFGTSINTSIQSQIVQHVIDDAQQTDFDNLVSQGTQQRYFDNEGEDLGSSPAPNSIYSVRVTPTPTLVPGSNSPSVNLLTVTIQIVHDPAHLNDPFARSPSIPGAETRTVFIARNSTNENK